MDIGDGLARLRMPQVRRAQLPYQFPLAVPRWWWFWPLLIYATTRLINAIMIVVASKSQLGFFDTDRSPGYFTTLAGRAISGYAAVATNWDGQWYWEIAAHGYPAELPRGEDGLVEQNSWAFFPLYPMTVRAVMTITGSSFPVAAVSVSLIFGAIAMLLLYRLTARRYGHLGGCIAVVGLSTFICAPVLQIAYSDGMALAIVLAALLTIAARQYWWTTAALLLLGLTRGVTLAFSLALVLYGGHLWRRYQLSRRHAISLGLLAVWATLCGFCWPVLAGLATGEPGAYVLTQQAWNPGLTTIPIVRFINRLSDGPGGQIVALGVALAWSRLLLWIFTKGNSEPIAKLWSSAYIIYLLAVVDWNWSAVRYYLLALPILWPLVRIREFSHRGWNAAVICALATAGLGTQWLWIRYAVVISPQQIQLP